MGGNGWTGGALGRRLKTVKVFTGVGFSAKLHCCPVDGLPTGRQTVQKVTCLHEVVLKSMEPHPLLLPTLV